MDLRPTTVLSAHEALAVLGGGVDLGAVGPLSQHPWLAVQLEPGPALEQLAALVPRVPAVMVGVTADGPPPPPLRGEWAGEAFDVVVSSGRDLTLVAEGVARSPQAAAALVRVLRAGARLPVWDALTLESFAYGLLQSGAEYRRWLDTRDRRPARRSEEPPVLVERDGPVLAVTLNRPAVRNALDAAMRDGLVEALAVASDPSVTAVHLRGAGPVFCSGGDLAEFGTAPDPATAHAVRSARSPAAALAQVADRVTASVHGACVGAGVELPAFAGRVVAAPDTTFRLPEIRMGLIPGAGGTVSLSRRLGRHRTAYLALSGEELDADRARQWGLVDDITG